jgi:HTH-type transcriptional regulator/antitoxin HigA
LTQHFCWVMPLYMGIHVNIYTERQYSDAQRQMAELDQTQREGGAFWSLRAGLPAELAPHLARAVARERAEISAAVEAYERAKSGVCDLLLARAGPDLGERLVATRICRGLSQKELARRLGIKEQAVQRWEADSYRSITLTNFQSVVSALGLGLSLDEYEADRRTWSPIYATPPDSAMKVMRHAKKHNWLDGAEDERELIRRIGDHVNRYGTPSLLRTGIREEAAPKAVDDWALVAWKAQVTWRAERKIVNGRTSYDPLNLSWIPQLVRLSALSDGPKKAQEFLEGVGIQLVVEPQVPGMPVDGAAFLLDGTPIIGMTLRKDTVDNFWFTLMHEVGHIVLHYRAGLSAGFFDDLDGSSLDEAEEEADFFAQNILIPDHVWAKSIVRIAKDPKVIKNFAQKLQIGPEIIFGRLRKERKDYSLFSKLVGQGGVRRLFPEYKVE